MATTLTLFEEVDALLYDWWCWTALFSLPLWYEPRAAVMGNTARISRQWDSADDVIEEIRRQNELTAVEAAVDELAFEFRRAIGVEMRNRHARAQVWRAGYSSISQYPAARDAIIPKLKLRGLLSC